MLHNLCLHFARQDGQDGKKRERKSRNQSDQNTKNKKNNIWDERNTNVCFDRLQIPNLCHSQITQV